MNYLNQDEREYRKFVFECEKKAIEITNEYNKLSNRNKSRVSAEMHRVLVYKLICGRF